MGLPLFPLSCPKFSVRSDNAGFGGGATLRYAVAMRRWILLLVGCAVLAPLFEGGAIADEGKKAHPPMLLVAKPDMKDPRFQGSVVLVTFHGGPSPVGVILNKPTDVHLNDLFSDLPEVDKETGTIHFGGPLSPEVLSFLVETDHQPQRALTIDRHIYLALDPDLLRHFVEHPEQRRRMRIYSGYAGWAPGQLDAEIDRGDWWTLPLRRRHLFPDDPEKLWERIVQELKGKWVLRTAPNSPGVKEDPRLASVRSG
ncbi:MAG: hypothetical protein Kow006_18340 [Gammaproteobacteria bacterium]